MYEFNGLVPGNYVVTFDSPGEEYKPSPMDATADDAADSDADMTTGVAPEELLSSGEDNGTIDAGFYRCSKVGDYVWLDQGTVSDVQDAGDVGLNGVEVMLFKSPDFVNPVQTTITTVDPRNENVNGYYNFEVCDEGTYLIKVNKPTQYIFVQPNQGNDDEIDSDVVDFNNQSTLTFTVGYAEMIDDIDIGLKSPPLPVKLIAFSGRWNQAKDINELSWTTESEINSDYFDVERSLDGGQFETIGQVAAKGIGGITHYSFDDIDIAANGAYTYRLRQVDLDGKFEYSNNVTINIVRKGQVTTTIYPNPSVSDVKINVGASEGSYVMINILDNNGKLVLRNLVDEKMKSNNLSTTIDKGTLAHGVYLVIVNVDGQITSHKLIIID
jgi:hypothetical protein